MLNIREFSRIAKVSPSAISLALRGRPGVSRETRERILSLAAELGYRPNPMVSALMTQVGARLRKRVESIIAVVSYMDLTRYPEHSTAALFVEGMTSQAARSGYMLENFVTGKNRRVPLPLSRMLEARCIRGIVLHMPEADFNRLQIDTSRYAFVSVGLSLRARYVDHVSSDHGSCMRLIIENLVRLGYRRIGLALDGSRPEHAISPALTVILGWQHGQTWKGQSQAIPPLTGADWGPERLLTWYRREKPDVIVCSDHLALKWLRAAGIRVPGTGKNAVAFAHLDLDARWKDMAGVDQCNQHVAAAAVDHLVSLLHANRYGFAEYPRTITIQGKWVDGDTAPPVA